MRKGKLSHFNAVGEAHMVDVGAKSVTNRIAVATGIIVMHADTLQHIRLGRHGKGDVLGVARIAGIMASKKTAELVPLCHPLALNNVSVDFELLQEESTVKCRAKVSSSGKTGVEMEALTAVQIALLTIYDMCKAVDRAMVMGKIQVIRKSGGKSGDWVANSADED